MIKTTDISFVVQGAIIPNITEQCLVNIRRIFPGAEIIVSTFESDIKIPANMYDKFIVNDNLPNQFYSSYPGSLPNNINRQINTSVNGLRIATRKYAMKVRTDFILQSNEFLKYFDLYPKFDDKYRIFEHKILSCTNFARNPRWSKYQYLHHLSDIAFFGLRNDLIKLFDVPLMTESDEKYYDRGGYTYNRYFPEQHLWVGCLNKNGHKIDFNRFNKPTAQQQTDTEKYFVSNFIFLSWAQFGLLAPKKFFQQSRIDEYFDYLSCITHCHWIRLYNQYIDPDTVVPRDKVYQDLIKFSHRYRKMLLVARLCVLPLFAFPKLRRRTRTALFNMGYKLFIHRLYNCICTEL